VEYNNKNQNLFVYPVPAKSTINIVFISQENNRATIKLFDAGGKLCRLVQTNVVRGINTLTLDLASLSPGQYTLSVEEINTIQVRSIIIL